MRTRLCCGGADLSLAARPSRQATTDPSPATRFTKGRPKSGGRHKGTPNKPISIKVGMKRLTDEDGEAIIEEPRSLIFGDDPKIKLGAIKIVAEYGIGTPAKVAPDTGRGHLIFHTKFPLGTDPDAMDRWFEEEATRRGPIKGGGGQQQRGLTQAQAKGRGKIFNEALLKAVGHREAKPPQEVRDALKTEDGDELEIVEHELPKIYEPDPQLREDE